MSIQFRRRTTSPLALAIVVGVGVVTQADYGFGTLTNLGPQVNSPSYDIGPSVSQDELRIYYNSPAASFTQAGPLLMATRANTDAAFDVPVTLDPAMFAGAAYPSISADGLSMYLAASWPGGSGASDIWVTTRATVEEDWGTPVNLGPVVNSTADESFPVISSDELTLYFQDGRTFAGERQRPGGIGEGDLWMSERAALNAPWGNPVNLGPAVNSPFDEGDPSISSDGLTLLFISTRPDGLGDFDIWVTTRASKEAPWREAVNLGYPINTSTEEALVEISRGGETLYFASTRSGGSGGMDLWQASIVPIVDFSGNGLVDIQDLLRLIEAWGEHSPTLDIGPGPFGDGLVDATDLEVLMRHWGQEVDDPTLKACWKLDEVEGDIAYDSGATHDAMVMGDASWQPDGGQLGGALQLDGIDDYVSTPYALNPADSVFSVFVWAKGGAAAQVILSQAGGANWLILDDQSRLQTSLKSNRREKDLVSNVTLDSDVWHRVGLTWDGTHRVLYVDDEEVALDTQVNLQAATGDLRIGIGSSGDHSSFWSGLIDDVRIYDRAVTP